MDELGVMISQAVDGSLVLTRPGGAQVALTAPEVALIRALPLSLNGATQAEVVKLRATREILQRWDAEGIPPRRVSPDPEEDSLPASRTPPNPLPKGSGGLSAGNRPGGIESGPEAPDSPA